MSALCRMVFTTKYEDLPDEVINYAKHCILDTMAVIIGGSAMEGVPEVVDYVKDKGGKSESIIPFYGGKVPASEAALAIGPMARAMDLGQVHEEAGHNSEYIVPTLLATAGLKSRATGKEFITAFVVGQEVLIRIGMAFKAVSGALLHGRMGGHYIFGAAAAAGKLLGLSLEELENAEGIAKAKTQPHDLAMSLIPTLMLHVHHGFVCHDAIVCCLLSEKGITGTRHEVLAGPRGYLEMAKWETNPSALTEGLGDKWEMLNVMMKAYTCCRGTHTAIDGIIDQIEEHNFAACDIVTIEIDESPINWNLTCEPKEVKWNPQTVAQCQYSLPYTVATAACKKGVFLDSYTQQAMGRRDVRELMIRISAKQDPSLPPWGARVTTTLKDGRKYSKEYVYIKGHPKNPFTEQELIDKFKTCVPYSAHKLSNEVVNLLIRALLSLDQVDDVIGVLVLPLTPK